MDAVSVPRRRDATRNRAALIDAATEAFRTEGLETAVDEIARRAGLGVATLYRHFPTKLDLIVAVTESTVERLRRAAEEAVANRDVLARFLASVLEIQRLDRGFMQAVSRSLLPPDTWRALRGQVLEIVTPVAAAAHAEGTLHPSLDRDDLLAAIRMLGASVDAVPPRTAERDLVLLLGGLARPAGT